MNVWLGWDAAETEACEVARFSMQSTTPGLAVSPLKMEDLRQQGAYWRPTVMRDGRWFDVVSDAPMSTGHAIARFFLSQMPPSGWVLFCDGDVLCRRSLEDLFALADDRYAVMVVPHAYEPASILKKDGAVQSRYDRKNWSSVMLWNTNHPAHRKLTLEHLNVTPGRDLHRFRWLEDELIGHLPECWNWLAGHSSPAIDPAIVHFTEGLPSIPYYAHAPYADEWRLAAGALIHGSR